MNSVSLSRLFIITIICFTASSNCKPSTKAKAKDGPFGEEAQDYDSRDYKGFDLEDNLTYPDDDYHLDPNEKKAGRDVDYDLEDNQSVTTQSSKNRSTTAPGQVKGTAAPVRARAPIKPESGTPGPGAIRKPKTVAKPKPDKPMAENSAADEGTRTRTKEENQQPQAEPAQVTDADDADYETETDETVTETSAALTNEEQNQPEAEPMYMMATLNTDRKSLVTEEPVVENTAATEAEVADTRTTGEVTESLEEEVVEEKMVTEEENSL